MARPLSRQARRLRAPKPPLGVVAAYQAVIRKHLAAFQSRAMAIVLRDWERNPVHNATGALREDSPKSTFTGRVLADLEMELEETFNPADLAGEIEILAARVNKKGLLEFKRTIGISLRGDLGIGSALDAFRDRNVDLITSLQGGQLKEITDLLHLAEKGAWRVEELRAKIQDRFDVTKSKGDLLARDQTLKLFGQVNQLRQTGAGITQYVWTTSGDERVREYHADLDGTLQSWSDPPIVSEDGRREHPGGDYQCRCTPYPVLPSVDEPSPGV